MSIIRYKEAVFLSMLTIIGVHMAFAAPKEIIVYCSLDQPYAEPILTKFEESSGIHVLTIYDSETVKTAGLVNRILAEKNQPQCDVFWNNEKLRIVLLAKRDALASYKSPIALTRNLPMDAHGFWTEFAARARVVVFSTKNNVHISDFNTKDEKWFLTESQIALASPLFGTTSTHMIDLMNSSKNPETWLKKVAAQKHIICSGNSDVVRRVAAGVIPFGFTDTDDVISAMSRGQAVDYFFPGGGIGNEGSLLIPNTVAIIKNAPHPKEAELLIDFLLSEETEFALANSASRQIPLGTLTHNVLNSTSGAKYPFTDPPHELIKTRSAHEEHVVESLEKDIELLNGTFNH
jgi:iron(III) transport system substrate-binding protein